MSRPGLCCDSCFNLIAEKSPDAARLWLDICDLQFSSQASIFALLTGDFATLRHLELLGFLLTTDAPDMTLVKVLGQKQDALGIYFCGGNCE